MSMAGMASFIFKLWLRTLSDEKFQIFSKENKMGDGRRSKRFQTQSFLEYTVIYQKAKRKKNLLPLGPRDRNV